jgi:hypothetical protein
VLSRSTASLWAAQRLRDAGERQAPRRVPGSDQGARRRGLGGSLGGRRPPPGPPSPAPASAAPAPPPGATAPAAPPSAASAPAPTAGGGGHHQRRRPPPAAAPAPPPALAAPRESRRRRLRPGDGAHHRRRPPPAAPPPRRIALQTASLMGTIWWSNRIPGIRIRGAPVIRFDCRTAARESRSPTTGPRGRRGTAPTATPGSSSPEARAGPPLPPGRRPGCASARATSASPGGHHRLRHPDPDLLTAPAARRSGAHQSLPGLRRERTRAPRRSGGLLRPCEGGCAT